MVLQRLLLPTFLVGVVGLIHNERGEVLLLRHTYRDDYPWGLPTGFLERGEQPDDALHREIREETGFSVSLDRGTVVNADRKGRLINLIFRGIHEGGSFIPSDEVSEARFFPLAALPPLLPDQRRLIETYHHAEVRHEASHGVSP